MTTETRPETTDPAFEEWVKSVDWDAIDQQNLAEDVGVELYKQASLLEELESLNGFENTVAIVASIMDGFRAHYLEHLPAGFPRHIANGFAQAMMRDHIARTFPEDEETS